MSKQNIALIVILVYMALTVAIGLISSARKKREKAEQSNEDFLMAGKSLGVLALAGTLFAANTGGASTIGIAQNVYRDGLSSAWYVIAAGIGFVIVSFVASYFRRSAANTVPQIIGMRFGKKSHLFTAVVQILALFMATGAQIIATSSIINALTGFDQNTAVIITTVVVIIYTMVGGLVSVASANMLHVFTIVVGMFVAMFFIVMNPEVGGFSNLFEKAREISYTAGNNAGQNANLLSLMKVGIPAILGYVAMYSMTFPTGQEIVQTYASAKDGKVATTGSIVAGIISAVFAMIPAIIGLAAYTFIPGFMDQSQNTALAQSALTFAPGLVTGLVLSGVVAATISSASGNMIGTATMFVNDVYIPYIKKNARNDKQEVLVSRIVMVVVGLFGMIVALTGANIITVMMSAFALRSAGPFAAFVTGLFSKKVTYNGGFIGIIAGTIVAAIWQFLLGVPFGLSAIVPGGIVALIVIFIVSAIEISRGKEPAPPIQLTDK